MPFRACVAAAMVLPLGADAVEFLLKAFKLCIAHLLQAYQPIACVALGAD